jgi:hypothetical protein
MDVFRRTMWGDVPSSAVSRAFELADDNLSTRHGDPSKTPILTKLGFKVANLFTTHRPAMGFWTDRGDNGFNGG